MNPFQFALALGIAVQLFIVRIVMRRSMRVRPVAKRSASDARIATTVGSIHASSSGCSRAGGGGGRS